MIRNKLRIKRKKSLSQKKRLKSINQIKKPEIKSIKSNQSKKTPVKKLLERTKLIKLDIKKIARILIDPNL